MNYQLVSESFCDVFQAAKKYNAEARDVKEVMDTWTLQMGFPVVTVKRKNGKASASQKHFLVHPKANVTRKSKFK